MFHIVFLGLHKVKAYQEKLLTTQAFVGEQGNADIAQFLMCCISLNVVFLL